MLLPEAQLRVNGACEGLLVDFTRFRDNRAAVRAVPELLLCVIVSGGFDPIHRVGRASTLLEKFISLPGLGMRVKIQTKESRPRATFIQKFKLDFYTYFLSLVRLWLA